MGSASRASMAAGNALPALLGAVALLISAWPAASVTCEGPAGPIWGNNNSFCCGEPGVQLICANGSRCMRPTGSPYPLCLAQPPPPTAAVNRSRAVICNPDGRTLYGLPGSKCCGTGDTTILCGKGYDCKITDDDRNLCVLSKKNVTNESEPVTPEGIEMGVVTKVTTLSEEAHAGSEEIAVASEDMLKVGDGVMIVGGGNAEAAEIAGMTEWVFLGSPLAHTYPAGSVVTVQAAGDAAAGTGAAVKNRTIDEATNNIVKPAPKALNFTDRCGAACLLLLKDVAAGEDEIQLKNVTGVSKGDVFQITSPDSVSETVTVASVEKDSNSTLSNITERRLTESSSSDDTEGTVFLANPVKHNYPAGSSIVRCGPAGSSCPGDEKADNNWIVIVAIALGVAVVGALCLVCICMSQNGRKKRGVQLEDHESEEEEEEDAERSFDEAAQLNAAPRGVVAPPANSQSYTQPPQMLLQMPPQMAPAHLPPPSPLQMAPSSPLQMAPQIPVQMPVQMAGQRPMPYLPQPARRSTGGGQSMTEPIARR